MEITQQLISEVLGWLGNIFFVVGAFIMAQRKRNAFIHQIIGNVFYVGQAYIMLNWSLGILSIGLIGVNIWSILNWKRIEAKSNG